MTNAWPALLIDAASGPEQVGPSDPQATGPLIVCGVPHALLMGLRIAARIVPSPSPHSATAEPFVLPPKLSRATTPEESPPDRLVKVVVRFHVFVAILPSMATTLVPVEAKSSTATVICPLFAMLTPASCPPEVVAKTVAALLHRPPYAACVCDETVGPYGAR